MKKKLKGGQEKLKLKRKRELESVAGQCYSIQDMFKKNSECQSENKTNNRDKDECDNVNEDTSIQENENYDISTKFIDEDNVDNFQTDPNKFEVEENKENLQIMEVNIPVVEGYESNTFFVKPHYNNIDNYFKYHPKQPTKKIPFNANIYNRKIDCQNRKWLTFCEKNCKLYCSICLAYGRDSDDNIFIKGFNNWSYVHQYIERHEKSKFHDENAVHHFMRTKNSSSITTQLKSVRHEKILFNRNILKRVIDVIKLIGKRGLSYRSKRNEGLHTLSDDNVDHGNFLEMVLLMSKYDDILKKHLDSCIKESKKIHQSNLDVKTQGRGNLVTFLSKTTVNYILEAISKLIKNRISKEINEAGMYSIQIDTTQDISVQDQCAVIVRYVNNSINERLLSIVSVESSTGEAFYSIIKEILLKNNLDIKKCIGNSTDGASNMQGKYRGFSAHMVETIPEHVHVWCYAHILNLVICDITQSSIAAASLFNLLNSIAIFIRESYIRMNIWNTFNNDNRRKKLNTIGETRWWAKDAILRKVFGNIGKPNDGLYIELILTLQYIATTIKFQPNVRIKAKSFLDSLIKFETILTAKLFLQIYDITTPISKYLQERSIDFIKAHSMVMNAIKLLKDISRKFIDVKKSADMFVNYVNNKLDEMQSDVEVEHTLPDSRLRKKKQMDGEKTMDDPIRDSLKSYEINVFNCVLDTAIQCMENRFSKNQLLYCDFACLDPKKFSENIPENAFQKLSSILRQFNTEATQQNIISEFNQFRSSWKILKENIVESFNKVNEHEDSTDDEAENIAISSCKACKNCPICCYNILFRYNMLSGAYTLLGQAYKYLLSISVTQVSCERSFSTLKFIKNRLRSSISQENLEAFMLMSVEKDILNEIDSNEIIDIVAQQSKLLKSKLME